MQLRDLLRRKPKENGSRASRLRDGFATYVLHGDNSWGNSITWSKDPTDEDGHHGRIVGWQPRKPQAGDRLLVAMQSGRWGWWLINSVEHADGVPDMFFAEVEGAFGYVDGDEVPKTKSASEFIEGSVFF